MKLLIDGDIETVIFDLGGVLVDWSPRRLYEKIFVTNDAVDYFLNYICSMEWNEQQDAGRTLQEGTDLLINAFPHYDYEIRSYYGRWEEMLDGAIDQSVAILSQIANESDIKLYALTNWSKETFPFALKHYDFLSIFEGILVSGEEGIKKPNPEIFKRCCNLYSINPSTALFIDDNLKNIKAAQDFGMKAIHFTSPEKLKMDLGI